LYRDWLKNIRSFMKRWGDRVHYFSLSGIGSFLIVLFVHSYPVIF